jgi:hypothetical protein
MVFGLEKSNVLIAVFIVLAASILLITIIDYSLYKKNNTSTTFSMEDSIVRRALLVDGLSVIYPGDFFVYTVKNILEDSGFTVDVVRGENVTVDFLLGLKHYDIIVLRLHSAISSDGELYLFTGEIYNDYDYFALKLTGVVAKGEARFENKTYFALNARYLGRSSVLNLTGSIVILMGCDGTKDQVFIDYLFRRGVSAYIAWDGYVSLDHSDKAILELLKAFARDGYTLEEALDKAMETVGSDPFYGAKLRLYLNPNQVSKAKVLENSSMK